MQLMRDALEVLPEDRPTPIVAELHGDYGSLSLYAGDRELALKHLTRAITMADALELPDTLGYALNQKAMVLLAESRLEAAALLGGAIKVAETHGLVRDAFVARANLADLRLQNDLPDALEEMNAALALATRLGARDDKAFVLGQIALLHLLFGSWDDSASAAEEAVVAAPSALSQTWPRYPLVLLHAYRGQTTSAAEQLSALEPWQRSDDIQERHSWLIAQAAVAKVENELALAFTSASKAAGGAASWGGVRSEGVRLAWPLAMECALEINRLDEAESLLAFVADQPVGRIPPYLRAQLARYRALVHIEKGDADTVEADLKQAVTNFTDLGYRYWLARAQADLARWLVNGGRPADAEPLLAEAIEVFALLGAEPDLKQLSPVRAGAAR
jgi:tetratricopeptide (TPR) repeat protein